MRLVSEKDYLEHHGIKGQKWGVRRYQNPDGSLTEEGQKRYLNSSGDWYRKSSKNPFTRKKEQIMKKAYNAKRDSDADRALDEMASIKDKTKKAEKEASLLRIYSGENGEWEHASPEEYAMISRIFTRIDQRYGNVYEGISSCKEFDKHEAAHKKIRDDHKSGKIDFKEYASRQQNLDREMSRTVLEKLNFETTPQNIELMIPFIIID